MPYYVNGVDVGGPRPAWADGETAYENRTVEYPHGLRLTDDQHEALWQAEAHRHGSKPNPVLWGILDNMNREERGELSRDDERAQREES